MASSYADASHPLTIMSAQSLTIRQSEGIHVYETSVQKAHYAFDAASENSNHCGDDHGYTILQLIFLYILHKVHKYFSK